MKKELIEKITKDNSKKLLFLTIITLDNSKENSRFYALASNAIQDSRKIL